MFIALPAFSSVKMNFRVLVLQFPLVLIQKLSSMREKSQPSNFFYISLTLVVSAWLSEAVSTLITFCSTGQPDEHSGQAVANKIEQLYLDAQDWQLPGDASPQPLHCGYPPFRSYQVMQESHPSKWLTSKELPQLYTAMGATNKREAVREKN